MRLLSGVPAAPREDHHVTLTLLDWLSLILCGAIAVMVVIGKLGLRAYAIMRSIRPPSDQGSRQE